MSMRPSHDATELQKGTQIYYNPRPAQQSISHSTRSMHLQMSFLQPTIFEQIQVEAHSENIQVLSCLLQDNDSNSAPGGGRSSGGQCASALLTCSIGT